MFELTLFRQMPKAPGYPVLGKLEGPAGMFTTLEDPYILRPNYPTGLISLCLKWPYSAWKIPGVTAIPEGRYRLYLTNSPRFGRLLPLVADVPQFTGIRIHRGLSQEHTEGCILIGSGVEGDLRTLRGTVQAEVELVKWLHDAAVEECWLAVKNP